MKIIFATNNRHKVEEIRTVLPSYLEVLSLEQAGIDVDIPEPHDNLRDNAAEKARTIHRLTGLNCFSEDTGLEVYALNLEPGVLSARYAGEEKSFEKNVKKLLENMKSVSHRKARFRTVFCLLWNGKEYFFEGICEGRIIMEPKGKKGFGYDPVFVPEGAVNTFAEMSMDEKNKFSHRRKAADMLVAFLNNMQVNFNN